MKLRDAGFIDSARVVGLSDFRIIRRHIIPNAMGPVMITVAFGIGGAVLLESGLSFLGIGLSIDQMSWGRMLNEARSNFAAWWLAALPGAAIFLTVAAFNRIAEDLSNWFERGN
jgi:peptide/nickel transport system permease protein